MDELLDRDSRAVEGLSSTQHIASHVFEGFEEHLPGPQSVSTAKLPVGELNRNPPSSTSLRSSLGPSTLREILLTL